MIRRPPRSTLFPYTTLFRSEGARVRGLFLALMPKEVISDRFSNGDVAEVAPLVRQVGFVLHFSLNAPQSRTRLRELRPRSEEHTSELQSRQYLVCRLLLEKK